VPAETRSVETSSAYARAYAALRDGQTAAARDLTDQILGARNLVGKDRCQEIVRPHPLNGCRDAFAAAESQNCKCSRCIPSPPCTKHRSREQRLAQYALYG